MLGMETNPLDVQAMSIGEPLLQVQDLESFYRFACLGLDICLEIGELI